MDSTQRRPPPKISTPLRPSAEVNLVDPERVELALGGVDLLCGALGDLWGAALGQETEESALAAGELAIGLDGLLQSPAPLRLAGSPWMNHREKVVRKVLVVVGVSRHDRQSAFSAALGTSPLGDGDRGSGLGISTAGYDLGYSLALLD